MTGFVERLAMRASGSVEVPGLALLRSRPATPFESSAVATALEPDLEANGFSQDATRDEERHHSVTARGKTAGNMPKSTPREAMSLAGRASRPAGKRTQEIEKGRPQDSTIAHDPIRFATQPRGSERDMAPQRQNPHVQELRNAALPIHSATTSAAPVAKGNTDVSTTGAVGPVRRETVPPVVRDRPPQAPSNGQQPQILPFVTQHEPSSEVREMPPSISIGKIEVQFVQPAVPPPAPRAAQSHARGFDSYARARRGEPR